MPKSVQYTTRQSMTLTDVARMKNLSRKLLFKIMEEQGLLVVGVHAKRLTSERYGYTTNHVNRTSIYIYTDQIEPLFKKLKIPKMTKHQKMCYECREVKGVKAFRERMATCNACRPHLAGKYIESAEEREFKINPYFLTRGLK